MTKNFFNFMSFFRIIIFMKSVATSSKIRTVISFYAKALKCFPEKNLRGYCGLAFIAQITFSRNFENNWNKNVNVRQLLKIILINVNSLLQMYPNEINFLTYWFLKIKCLFDRYLKTTKKTAIHKNRFLQSFKTNTAYSLVTGEV